MDDIIVQTNSKGAALKKKERQPGGLMESVPHVSRHLNTRVAAAGPVWDG